MTPPIVIVVPDDAPVIPTHDTASLKESAFPSTVNPENDIWANRYTIGSLDEVSNEVSMTNPYTKFPKHGSSIVSKSTDVSGGKVSNSISIGGSNNAKDNVDVMSKVIISPSLNSSKSRPSLIDLAKPLPIRRNERWYNILSQLGLPFLLAGMGMVGAGILLNAVIRWPVFIAVEDLVVLVTPLLGLKGNLEMTLAARLSTHANMGNLDIPGNKWRICSGNLVLDQVQAIICGLLASIIAIATRVVIGGDFDFQHATLVVSASILTASMVSLILGSTMTSVILLAKRFGINPDNVATPIAGSLGDVVTLGLLSFFASYLYEELEGGKIWIPFAIISVYTIILPFTVIITYRNEFTRQVVICGWIPLIISVGISTAGGLLLDLAGTRYPGLVLYQPVVNGIGGNLVSVQASRISTQLHVECEENILPNDGRACESPFAVFFTKSTNSMSARLLLLLVAPGHFIFSTVIHFMAPDSHYSPLFLSLYISAAIIQVGILLYIAKIMTNICWKGGIDPDTTTIPYLTAIGDLLGTSLLFMAFELLTTINDGKVSHIDPDVYLIENS